MIRLGYNIPGIPVRQGDVDHAGGVRHLPEHPSMQGGPRAAGLDLARDVGLRDRRALEDAHAAVLDDEPVVGLHARGDARVDDVRGGLAARLRRAVARHGGRPRPRRRRRRADVASRPLRNGRALGAARGQRGCGHERHAGWMAGFVRVGFVWLAGCAREGGGRGWDGGNWAVYKGEVR